MAVTIDIGDSGDIHPRNKQEVGRRLGLCAIKVAYGMDIVHYEPVYESMAVRDGRIHLRFRHTGGGLDTLNGKSPGDFFIAGKGRNFFPPVPQSKGTG